MEIKVNGESQVINQAEVTISSLLTLNQVEMPDMVSVQLNGEFVDRDKFPVTLVSEHSEVEFLYFMGGGA